MSPRIVPFKPIHAWMLTRDLYSWELGKLYAPSSFGWTAVLDAKPIASGGICIVEPGLGSLWAFFSDEIRRFPLWLCRMTGQAINETVRKMGPIKLDAAIAFGSERDRRWLEMYGFMPAGPLDKDNLRMTWRK